MHTLLRVLRTLLQHATACPIKFFTGVSCPGCGMTRAMLAALRLDFGAALQYHPLFWAVLPVLIAVVLLRRHKKARAGVLLVSVVAMVGVWLYRMIFMDTDIVVFAPQNGLIPSVIRWIRVKW